MKPNKWLDFLFTVAVRFICGVVLGCIAALLVGYRAILRAFSHDHSHTALIFLIACGVIGGLIGACTVPHWQTPWYKGAPRFKDLPFDDPF